MNYIIAQLKKNSHAVKEFINPMNNSKDWRKMQEDYARKKTTMSGLYPQSRTVSL